MYISLKEGITTPLKKNLSHSMFGIQYVVSKTI